MTREVLVHGGVLAGQADLRAQGLGVAHDVQAGDLGAPSVGQQQGGEDADPGRLAGAVGAEEPEDRPRRHLEVDALQRMHGAEVLGERLGTDDRVGHGAPGYRSRPTSDRPSRSAL